MRWGAVGAAVMGLWLSGQAPLGAAEGEPWQVGVPGAWESQLPDKLADYNGEAWYRCYFKTPDIWLDWNLYADSLVLAVRQVADCHEVFVNGQKIGGAGKFPPEFASAATQAQRYKVPAPLLKKGEFNTLAVRVYNRAGPGGFLAAAPILSSYEHEMRLAGAWEFRTGAGEGFALPSQKERPAAAVFEKVDEASFALEPLGPVTPGDRLPPVEALATLQHAAGLAIDQVLAEPHVAQPLHLSFDERGRLWVVEYRQYPHPAGLAMVSRNKYYRFVYDKTPLPPPHGERGADRISIHEDADGNGTFERHSVFVEGLNIATSCARGNGGVWVLNPPYLLFYADANGDDVPDGDPSVHLSGFGLEDTHATTNSLRWGPDGWLYSTQGSNVVAHVRVWGGRKFEPGQQPAPVAYLEGPGVWRYHPTRHTFEIYAEGSGNAYGLELDGQGRFYSGHNGGNTRGYHYVQGGYYDKGVEAKFMPVSNPFAFGTLPAMAHAPVPRFTHALVRYEGTNLPEPYRGGLLSVDPLHHQVMASAVEPRGASFATRDLGPAVASSDRAFRPVAIAVGPDEAVYVADFYEHYIAHGQHYQGQIDPSTGRVYRLRGEDSPPARCENLAAKTSASLVALLGDSNRWKRQTALRLLAERADRSVLPALAENLQASGSPAALDSLWALYQLGGYDDGAAELALRHTSAGVRRWGVHLADALPAAAPRMAQLAAHETDREVLCQLAATARRLPAPAGLAITWALLARDDLANDPYLPKMIWWSLEARCGENREEVLAGFSSSRLWPRALVRQYIAEWLVRRFAGAGTRDDYRACAQLFAQAPDEQLEALTRGFEMALAGQPAVSLPEELVVALRRTRLAQSLPFRLRTGDERAVGEALAQLAAEQAPLAARLELAAVLGEVKLPAAVPALLAVVEKGEPAALRVAAAGALAAYEERAIGSRLVPAVPQLPPEVREAVLALLATRSEWTAELLSAVEAAKVPAATVSLELARRLALHEQAELRARVEKLWPIAGPPAASDARAAAARLGAVLAAGSGNPYAGRPLFEARCGKCHSLFGLGGSIGPELTALRRDDRAVLLLHVLDPSAEIREGFEMHVATTGDGRVLAGFLVDQDRQTIALRTQEGQTVRVPRDDLERFEKSRRSLMPEGLLADLTDVQLRDLFAYLQASQPGR